VVNSKVNYYDYLLVYYRIITKKSGKVNNISYKYLYIDVKKMSCYTARNHNLLPTALQGNIFMGNQGPKSTRERVLYILLKQNRCTINDLAIAVDINPISVRHHITKLEAEGLVDSEEERHGVGRPRRVYFLTEEGREKFPTRYMRLATRILQQLKVNMPEQVVNELFSDMAEDLAQEYARSTNLDGLPMEERLAFVKDVLAREGFDIEYERKGDHYHIRELSCPYFHIGQDHPEVCRVDQTIISSVLNVPAEKIKCVLNGDSHCTYVVPDFSISENGK